MATDTRTGQIVIADEDLKVMLERPASWITSSSAGAFPMRMSRSMSALAEPKTPCPAPSEDPQQTRLGQPVFRPFVPVSLRRRP